MARWANINTSNLSHGPPPFLNPLGRGEARVGAISDFYFLVAFLSFLVFSSCFVFAFRLFLLFSFLTFDSFCLSLRPLFTSIASELTVSGTLCAINEQAIANQYPEGGVLAVLPSYDIVESIGDRFEDPSAVSGKKGEKGIPDSWDAKDGEN
jgi:hypothetical protein